MSEVVKTLHNPTRVVEVFMAGDVEHAPRGYRGTHKTIETKTAR